MVKELLNRFIPNNLIKSDDMPSTSRITLTGCDDYRLLHVKVTYPEIKGNLGTVEEHNILPEGRVIAIKGEYEAVARLPEKTVIKSEIKDGYTYIVLPEIVGYDMFFLS